MTPCSPRRTSDQPPGRVYDRRLSDPRPTLAKLDLLWEQHRSNWRRLLSRGAVTELMLRANFDLDLLVPEEIANRVPLGTVPNCPECNDVCCAGVENVVSLRLRDIAVLIDIGRTDLMKKEKPRFPEWMLQERPAIRELVASELFARLPVLVQLGEDRICAALTPELRCSLHPNWPLSCERFPYSLGATRREVVWGRRCQSKKLDPELAQRGREMFRSAISVYNERVKDAVLLAHATKELDAIGIGAFLTPPGADPFEPEPLGKKRRRLPIFG